jgi:hypothetical protein
MKAICHVAFSNSQDGPAMSGIIHIEQFHCSTPDGCDPDDLNTCEVPDEVVHPVVDSRIKYWDLVPGLGITIVGTIAAALVAVPTRERKIPHLVRAAT